MNLEDLHTRKGSKGRFQSKNYYSDLKGGSGSNKKEVLLKVASNITKNNSKSATNAIDYITKNGDKYDEEFIHAEDENGNKLSQDDLNELKKNWSDEFDKEKRKDARLITHFVLSIDDKPTKKNIIKFDKATRELLQEKFGNKGYEYVYALHKNTDKTHAHIIIKNRNNITRKKLRITKDSLFDARTLAVEKLTENGFSNYKATLKRDRLKINENEKKIEKEFKQVNNWYDAILKRNSNNTKQFEILTERKRMLDIARSNYKENKNIDTTMDFKKNLQSAKNEILNYGQNKSRLDSDIAIGKVFSNAKVTATQIKKMREEHLQSSNKKNEHSSKKEAIQNFRVAQELINNEIQVEQSQHYTPEVKKKLLDMINTHKRGIDPNHEIDYDHLKNTQLTKAHYSDALKTQLKEVEKINRGEPTDKKIYRCFRQTVSASKLEENEKLIFSNQLNNALSILEEKGFPAHSMQKKWEKQQKLSRVIRGFSDENTIKTAQQQKEVQKVLNAIKEQIPKDAISKRDQIALTKSLEVTQALLDKKRGNERFNIEKELKRQHRAIKALDSKLDQGKKILADRQLFAMTKTYLSINERSAALPTQEKITIDKALKSLALELQKRGGDLNQAQERATQTNSLKNNINTNTKVLSMLRPTIKQLNNIINQVTQDKKQLGNTDLNISAQRQTNKTLNVTRDQALLLKQQRQNEFDENIKRMNKLANQARDLKKQPPESAMQKVEQSRKLDALGKEFNKLNMQLTNDMDILPTATERHKVKTQIQTMARNMPRTGRGMSR